MENLKLVYTNYIGEKYYSNKDMTEDEVEKVLDEVVEFKQEFTHTDRLKSFLDNHLKNDYVFELYFKEVVDQLMETDSTTFELKNYETKSGNAETYAYTRHYIIDGSTVTEILEF